jgi:hypothetical protein
MNRHYPNRDTIIKKVLRSNPVIKDTILYSVEAYNNVYIYRLVDLDKYLERFKAYVKFKYISATFFQEGMNFCIYLKRRQFKSITFMGFISFISHLSCLFFMVYVVYVEPYYYHRCVYNHVGIVLILAIIYRIIGAWAIQLINQKFDKEKQEIDQEYEKFVREEKEAHEKFVREDNERVISDLISAMLNRKEKLISQKEQLETCLENEKDKNSAKYKEDSNRLKETNESILLVDSAIVDLGEWKSGLMSKEEFKKKWNIK